MSEPKVEDSMASENFKSAAYDSEMKDLEEVEIKPSSIEDDWQKLKI
jgi:hypothetical protein